MYSSFLISKSTTVYNYILKVRWLKFIESKSKLLQFLFRSFTQPDMPVAGGCLTGGGWRRTRAAWAGADRGDPLYPARGVVRGAAAVSGSQGSGLKYSAGGATVDQSTRCNFHWFFRDASPIHYKALNTLWLIFFGEMDFTRVKWIHSLST